MSILFLQFQQAYQRGLGPLLATTITPISPPEDENRLRNIYKSYDSRYTTSFIEESIITPNRDLFSDTEGELWVELYLAYWKAIVEILDAEDSKKKGSWVKAYEAWKEVANALIRGYGGGFQAWTVPCMYVVGRYLRIFAIKADQSTKGTGNNVKLSVGGLHDDLEGAFGKNETLEDAARQINRLFTLCLSDRAPLEESRKWGLYYITNLLFKTYFKLNSIGLSKNILRALGANTEMPPIESFPKSHIVTYKYYVGVILFLNEAYLEAEENLTNALEMCHKDAHKNKELILTYLIPCHLLTTHTLPSPTLLLPYPRLNDLFKPLSICIRRGDLAGFDAALAAGEDEFVKRRIYLTLERGRDIALRNLLRKVSIAGGFTEGQGEEKVRRTRIPLQEFIAAIRVGSSGEGRQIDGDEVECLLANMIYKNLMKGYISREKSMVVLSKTGAFPGTNI